MMAYYKNHLYSYVAVVQLLEISTLAIWQGSELATQTNS